MRNHKASRQTTATIIALLLVLSPILIGVTQSIPLTTSQEYKQFVHTTINSTSGNVTVVDKPIFPVKINNTQIQIGQNWTIICPLQASHNYQIYCYGTWTNTQTEAKTDYDIYVHDPSGQLVSTHTQAAGVIENINSQSSNFFTATQSGNYSFIIKNDARESQGTQEATFMIMENIECNKWYTVPVQGKAADSTANLKTAWTYEFATNASLVEVYLSIPDTLDMYEARLFLMNDGSGLNQIGYPLADEPGLYSNITATGVGGYNFETNGSRGVAYDSCEHMGQDMFLSYTAKTEGTKLYYLVLIGEEGQGDVQFMAKTNFDEIALTPANTINRPTPGVAIEVTYKTSGYNLEEANMSYSVNNWATAELIPMTIINQTCSATVPGQTAGKTVQYRIDAIDVLKNSLSATGSYTVKNQPKLNITIAKDTVVIGQNITVEGVLTPSDADSAVDIQFMSSTETVTVTCEVAVNGSFSGSFGPQTAGDWSVLANALETDVSWGCSSSQYMITVNEPPLYIKYGLYIVIGMIAACAVGGVVYYLKFRGR